MPMDKDNLLNLVDELCPVVNPADATPQTHEQAMACTDCGLAGFVPDEHFPQQPGVWDRPCPKCSGTVWVTAVRETERSH